MTVWSLVFPGDGEETWLFLSLAPAEDQTALWLPGWSLVLFCIVPNGACNAELFPGSQICRLALCSKGVPWQRPGTV